MKFVADESVDQPIVDYLRTDGHVVWAVVEMDPGIADDKVLDIANQQNALLLTADKDFGELVFRLKKLSHGIILLRLPGIAPARKALLVSANIHEHEDELSRNFTVISRGSIRIRRSPEE